MKGLKKINWKRMLFDNWVLKLASLTIAFILWFIVIIEEDPVQEKNFYGIKVNLVNTEQLEKLGRVYEVLDGTDTVRSVTVKAARSILDELDDGDIVAQADFDNISGMNTVEIEYFCPKYSRDVTEIEGNINNVKLSIEDKSRKSLSIRYNVLGEVTEGNMISSTNGISMDVNRLQVEGPSSKVSQIAKAFVDVDVTGANSGFATPLEVYFLDDAGNKVEFDSVSQSVKTVNVNVDVLKIKEVAVRYEPFGEVAEGYLPTGVVEGAPYTVKIAARPDLLKRVDDEIVIREELDITGATETLHKKIDLNKYLRTGVIFADEEFDGGAHVSVYVEPEVEKTLRLRRENLQIINVPDGILAEVVLDQEMPQLMVTGLSQNISLLRESTLKGTIDLTAWMEENAIESLSTGVHSIPVEIQLEEGQNQQNSVNVFVQFSLIEE